MSWETNREKRKPVRDQFKRRNNLRRMRERILEEEPIDNFRWDLDDEREGDQVSQKARQRAMG